MCALKQIPCLICYQDFPGKFSFPFCSDCKGFVLKMNEINRELVKIEQEIQQIAVNVSAKILSTLGKHSGPEDGDRENIPLIDIVYTQRIKALREQIAGRYTVSVNVSVIDGPEINAALIMKTGGIRTAKISSKQQCWSSRNTRQRSRIATAKRKIEVKGTRKRKTRGETKSQGIYSDSETETTPVITKRPRGKPKCDRKENECGLNMHRVSPGNDHEISQISTATITEHSQKQQSQPSSVPWPKQWEETVYKNLLMSKGLLEMLRSSNSPEIVIDESEPDDSRSDSDVQSEFVQQPPVVFDSVLDYSSPDSDESDEFIQPMVDPSIFSYTSYMDATTSSVSSSESADEHNYTSKIPPPEAGNQGITESALEDLPFNFKENFDQLENIESLASENAFSTKDSEPISVVNCVNSGNSEPTDTNANPKDIYTAKSPTREDRAKKSKIIESNENKSASWRNSEYESMENTENTETNINEYLIWENAVFKTKEITENIELNEGEATSWVNSECQTMGRTETIEPDEYDY
ncbi:unnamed protein product [Allacma fusca]|uniref:Uncharacterized protein n=1 Tax=Allacma fusca TaxID=39272 RepID=A0A8J2KWQ4_9HEXA|nr:unnamed protein product [Allacma fusca]